MFWYSLLLVTDSLSFKITIITRMKSSHKISQNVSNFSNHFVINFVRNKSDFVIYVIKCQI